VFISADEISHVRGVGGERVKSERVPRDDGVCSVEDVPLKCFE